jgi:hypothetical protein
MGPARNFTESLTPDPELENSLGQQLTSVHRTLHARFTSTSRPEFGTAASGHLLTFPRRMQR